MGSLLNIMVLLSQGETIEFQFDRVGLVMSVILS